jgi:hypothetical protein
LPDDALSALSGALKMLEVRIGEVAATAGAAGAGSAAPSQAPEAVDTVPARYSTSNSIVN